MACGAAARRAGLNYLVVERGCIANTILHFPRNLRFFSTAGRLAIGGVPFIASEANPTRREALDYYRQVTAELGLRVRQYEEVTAITPDGRGFLVETGSAGGRNNRFRTGAVVMATGYFDTPNRLGVPGEDSPHVSYYYTEGHPFYGQRVVVVGGRNSAIEAALDLYRCGAEVTLVHRGPDLSDRVKPWVLPFMRSLLNKGEISARFERQVKSIEADGLTLRGPQGDERMPADFIFILTGYRPDHRFLRGLGVVIDEESGRPQLNHDTMETDVPGLFVAGVLAAGYDANKIFIENGRFHGPKIMRRLLQNRGSTPDEAARLLPLPDDPDALEDPTFST